MSSLYPQNAGDARSCVFMPASLILDASLSDQAKIMYGVLLSRRDNDTGVCRSLMRDIARSIGKHPGSVRRAIAELVDAGWISGSTDPDFGPNTYGFPKEFITVNDDGE